MISRLSSFSPSSFKTGYLIIFLILFNSSVLYLISSLFFLNLSLKTSYSSFFWLIFFNNLNYLNLKKKNYFFYLNKSYKFLANSLDSNCSNSLISSPQSFCSINFCNISFNLMFYYLLESDYNFYSSNSTTIYLSFSFSPPIFSYNILIYSSLFYFT